MRPNQRDVATPLMSEDRRTPTSVVTLPRRFRCNLQNASPLWYCESLVCARSIQHTHGTREHEHVVEGVYRRTKLSGMVTGPAGTAEVRPDCRSAKAGNRWHGVTRDNTICRLSATARHLSVVSEETAKLLVLVSVPQLSRLRPTAACSRSPC